MFEEDTLRPRPTAQDTKYNMAGIVKAQHRN